MQPYTRHYNKIQTDQQEEIPGKDMVQNSAGGYVFQISPLKRLERFLILGSDGGTYYASEKKLTIENAKCVEECLDQDYIAAIHMIVQVAESGRAPKKDPALFALAIAAGHKKQEVRQHALHQLSRVAKTGSHLLMFAEMVKGFRGWGRGLKSAIGHWYSDKAPGQLAYQAIKYQQRNGWSHRDLLRLAHPIANTPDQQAVFRYIVKGRESELTDVSQVPDKLKIIWAWEKAKTTTDIDTLISLITEYNLPHECVPNDVKKDPRIWEGLLQHMPMEAMLRNIGRMSSIGLLVPGSESTKQVVERLQNTERVQQSKLHPLKILVAATTYGSGHGLKGSLSWTPVSSIKDALEDSFYSAFQNVQPTNKLTLIGLDVSGSMTMGTVCGSPLQPNVAAACMCLVTARTEPHYEIMGFSHEFKNLNITAKDTLASAIQKTSDMSFGATDCALPMLYALKQKVPYENFIVYTDNETFFGKIHPCQALCQVRKELGVQAKLAVVGMTATGFSIADKNDAGTIDCVGFDTATPQIMSDFFRGEEKIK